MQMQTLTGDRWQFDRSDERVEVLPGLSAPLIVQTHGSWRRVMKHLVTDEAHLDPSPKGRTVVGVKATFSEERGHYILRSMSVNAPVGEEVNGTLLREITPQRIMRWALPPAFYVVTDENGDPPFSRWAHHFISPMSYAENMIMSPVEGGPTPENIRAVAEIYRLAGIVREGPAKAVADTMGLRPRTATNWITKARDEGLLVGARPPSGAFDE